MVIKIRTNEDIYFRQLLELVSSMKPLSSLTNREKELLSIMLRMNWKYKDLPDKDRKIFITGSRLREIAEEELDVKDHSIRTLIHMLKKKGFIVDGDLSTLLKNLKFGEDCTFKFIK